LKWGGNRGKGKKLPKPIEKRGRQKAKEGEEGKPHESE